MFKKLGILTILVVLALMVSVPAVSARGQGPPDHVERGQALATGSIWVDGDIHINFNARAGVFLEKGVEGFEEPHYAATGHIFWREDGQINRIRVDRLAFQWWPHMFPPDCTLISGIVYDGPRAVVEEGEYTLRLCFIVCETVSNLGTDVAGQWNGDFFFVNIIRGNFVIKE